MPHCQFCDLTPHAMNEGAADDVDRLRAAAALKLTKELAAEKPDSIAFPFTEGPRAGAGAGYMWNPKASPPYAEIYEATCWPVGVNPK